MVYNQSSNVAADLTMDAYNMQATIYCVQVCINTTYTPILDNDRAWIALPYNPRRACAARVIVVVPVCYHYSGTTGYEAAKERYQRPERYVGIVFKKAIFLKLLRSRVMA